MKYLAAFVGSGLVTALVMAWVVHALPMQIYEESYPMYAYEKEVEEAPAREPATTLIVGDSRAKASLLPDKLGSGSLSLTLPGASAIELYHAADRYLSRHPAPRNVVLSISAVHFGDAFIFWERPIKFGYLDQAAVDEVLDQARRLGDPTFGSPWDARLSYLLHRLNSPHLYLPELRRAVFHPHGAANQQLLAQLERERGHCFFGTAPAFQRAGLRGLPRPVRPVADVRPLLSQADRSAARHRSQGGVHGDAAQPTIAPAAEAGVRRGATTATSPGSPATTRTSRCGPAGRCWTTSTSATPTTSTAGAARWSPAWPVRCCSCDTVLAGRRYLRTLSSPRRSLR